MSTPRSRWNAELFPSTGLATANSISEWSLSPRRRISGICSSRFLAQSRCAEWSPTKFPRRAGNGISAPHFNSSLVGSKRDPFRPGRNLRSPPDGPDWVGTRRNHSSFGRGRNLRSSGVTLPWFFVSVASKGLRVCVSGLESTLAGISTSVDSKGVYVTQKLCKTGLFLLGLRVTNVKHREPEQTRKAESNVGLPT